MLRRGESRDDDNKELEKREDEVEERLEGWREEQEGDCAANCNSGERGCVTSMEL